MTGALARSVAALTSALSRPDAAGHLNVAYGPRVGPVELGHRMFCNFRDCKPLRALRRRCRGWEIAQVLDQGVPGSPRMVARRRPRTPPSPRQALTATRRITEDRVICWTAIIGDTEKRPAAGMKFMHQFRPRRRRSSTTPPLGSCWSYPKQFCFIVGSRRYSRRKVCHAMSVPLPPVTMSEVRRR